MKWQQGQDSPAAVHVVVLDPDEEAVAELTGFARAQSPGVSQATAVGAFPQATVGWFDRAAKDYRRTVADERCEVLSLLGDGAVGEDVRDGPAALAKIHRPELGLALINLPHGAAPGSDS
ncbi:PCC domain-containing protein [Streptomyces sp. NPDC058335]|uniref:PCC domain-containing protein n=1 Tax=Streptomyces sp. NPDC058335 TaxID=3346451 RepID=UPI003649CCEA